MANTSILAAFERMWQHIVAALSNKSNVDHTHSDATQATSGFMSAEDKIQLDNGGMPIVSASSNDGVSYTATVDGIHALIVGMKITVVPSVNSASTTPLLNVNGLGDKYVRMPITYNTSATSVGATEAWLVKDKPVVLEYDGLYWKTINIPRPAAQYLYGVVPVENGGTGADTAESARTNLEVSQAIEDTTYAGCYYRMVDGEKEWINPPMSAGVEYRTTERYYGGDVVYTYMKVIPSSLLVDIMDSSYCEFTDSLINNNMRQIVSITGMISSSTGERIPLGCSGSMCTVNTNDGKIKIKVAEGSMPSITYGFVIIKYTHRPA